MQNAIASILIYSCLKRSIFEAADERGHLLGVEKFLLAITYAIYILQLVMLWLSMPELSALGSTRIIHAACYISAVALADVAADILRLCHKGKPCAAEKYLRCGVFAIGLATIVAYFEIRLQGIAFCSVPILHDILIVAVGVIMVAEAWTKAKKNKEGRL